MLPKTRMEIEATNECLYTVTATVLKPLVIFRMLIKDQQASTKENREDLFHVPNAQYVKPDLRSWTEI